jgi:hypothetical protein
MVESILNTASPSACQLLASAIRKRRAVQKRKEPDFRMEILLGNTIKSLCRMIGEERAADRKRKRDASPIAASSKVQVMNNRQTMVVPSAPSPPNLQENRKPEKPNDSKDSWSKHPEAYDDVFGLNEIFECLRPVNRTIAAVG